MASPHNITQAERVAALEIRVTDIQAQQQEINNKLDDLLCLRNQGVGVFWLASALLGTGIIGFLDVLVRKWLS